MSSFAAILLLAVPVSVQAEDTPRSAMRKGLKAYRNGDYTNAVQWLEKTVPEFPAVGRYNIGNVQYRQENYEAAAESYNEALRTTDLELQSKAYFNRGCALLGRTTQLTGPEQIGLAAELAYQASDMFEKVLLLDPDDLAAKQNFERARNLQLQLEYNQGQWAFDRAEALLQEYKAKDARTQYRRAREQFEHILQDLDQTHAEAAQYLPKIEERLEMLRLAVEAAEYDLQAALRQIEDYQYMLAAQRLTTETDERKYAFDLKPELKKKYEETIKRNEDVLKIVRELSELNIVE